MKKIIESFKDKKILLIGDIMLDIYAYGDVIGQSPDAPSPEVEEKEVKVSFGGNGLVATNILELGGKLTFISVVGDDEDANSFESFVHPNLNKYFLIDKTRRSTVKKRWFAGGKKIIQVNKVDNHYIDEALEKEIISIFKKEINKHDEVIIMDPQHGMLTQNLISSVVKICKDYGKTLLVDVQVFHRPSNHHLYKGVDYMILNQKEAISVSPNFDFEKPIVFLKEIQKELEVKNVIVKLGGEGSIALIGDRFIKTLPHRVNAVDVCGAGDAFLAAFSLSNREDNIEGSLHIANIWAGLSTEIHGTTPPKKENLLNVIRKVNDEDSDRIKIKLFADGADLEGIKEMATNPLIQGFTTNPTLMRKAGVSDYKAFAREALHIVGNKAISFEVFADDFPTMEKQALEIASWGENVYVKIPVTNTKKEFSGPLIKRLSGRGIKLNITAIMTVKQVEDVLENLDSKTPAIISVFAGRIADTGRDPMFVMAECLEKIKSKPKSELLWASPREILNVFQADLIGCHIITATNDILKKISLVGKDLELYSLETVKMFFEDAQSAGYSIE